MSKLKIATMSFTLASAALALAPVVAISQTPEEYRTRAEEWMKQPVLKIDFTSSNGWSSTFETNTQAKTTNFVGSRDQTCLGSKIPTEITSVDDQLVLEFKSPPGCSRIQYRFNPITGEGVVHSGASGSDTLSPTKAKIALRR